MYNLYVIFSKFLCKQVTGNLVNESQNILRRDVAPKLSNFEIVALNIVTETVDIDSEFLLLIRFTKV